MGKYTIVISKEMESKIQEIAEATGAKMNELIQDFVDSDLEAGIASMVIEQYKKGNLKAREAWKMTGLSYQEFQTRATA